MDEFKIVDFKTQPEYREVQQIVKDLNSVDRLRRFQGACLAASEAIQALLHTKGIKSSVFECRAVVVNRKNVNSEIFFVGFDSLDVVSEGDTDTHFVVLVEAAQPFIVDASIGELMGNHRLVIVAPLSSTDPDIVAEASFQDAKVTYRVKKHLRFEAIHQKTMMEKLDIDKQTRNQVSKLSLVVKVLIGIGIFNAVMNITLIVLKNLYP